jgi:anti-sigma B factor antagonist
LTENFDTAKESALQVLTETVGGIAFLEPDAKFVDASNAPNFKSGMLNAIDLTKLVAIDMRYIEFMDSTGLGAMVAFLRRVEKNEGRLLLCNMQPKVRTLFELVRLYKIFEIFNDRDACLRAVGSAR